MSPTPSQPFEAEKIARRTHQCHVLPDGQRFRLRDVRSQESRHDEGQEILVERDAAFP